VVSIKLGLRELLAVEITMVYKLNVLTINMSRQNPSEGAEWETNVVAVLKDDILPPGYIEKTPIKSGHNWSITLESFGHEEAYCPFALEIQLGPFFGDTADTFNKNHMHTTCSELTAVWNQMMEEGKMTLDEQYSSYGPMDLLITSPFGGGDNTFASCKDYYDFTMGRLLDPYAEDGLVSTTVIPTEYIRGSPQMTVGIKLSKVCDLYAMLFLNVKNCPPGSCNLANEEEIYNISAFQVQKLEEAGQSISKELFGLILLVNSHIMGLIAYYNDLRPGDSGPNSNADGGHIDGTKAMSILKNRSNLMTVLESLNRLDQDSFGRWWFAVYSNRGLDSYPEFNTISQDQRGRVYSFLQQFYQPTTFGYKITSSKNPRYTTDVSSFIIVSLPENISAKTKIQRAFNIEGPFWVTRPYEQDDPAVGAPPTVVIGRNDTLNFIDTNAIKNFDMGEWSIFEGGIVHVELRAWQTFVLISGDLENPKQRDIPIEKFCARLQGLAGFLDGLFEGEWSDLYPTEAVPGLQFPYSNIVPPFPREPDTVRRSGRASTRDPRDASPGAFVEPGRVRDRSVSRR
jgi:hypothetical protein